MRRARWPARGQALQQSRLIMCVPSTSLAAVSKAPVCSCVRRLAAVQMVLAPGRAAGMVHAGASST